jgi:hypothetical protein
MLRLVGISFALLLSAPSWARSYDVSLSKLGDTPADKAKYRSLAQEMGLVLAPLHIGPARTTGHSGFEYTLRYSSHNIHQTRPYWTDVSEGGVMDLDGATNAPDTLSTTTIEVRKGLPFGLELGTNLTWLENSQTLALGGRVRIGLLEGYQQSYSPDISVQASVNRMLGSTDLDLTTIAAGATVSYRKSIAGRLTLSPFFGFDFLLVQAGSHLLINPAFQTMRDAGCEDADEPINQCPDRLIVYDPLALDDADNQWSRVRYGLRIESILFAFTVQHDVPIDDRERPDQHAISVGLSAHF